MPGDIELHFVIVFLVLVLQLAYDITAKTRWLPSYFEGGPLVISQSYPTDPQSNADLTVNELQTGFQSASGKSLLFGQIGQNKFGFRKGLLDIGIYRRIDKGFEGLLVWDKEAGSVELMLHLSWITIGLYSALFLGLLLAALSDLPDSLFSLGSFLLLVQVMDGLFAVAGWLEFRRGSRSVPSIYDEIGNFVADSLSQPASASLADA